ncbi:MAG: sulfate adenylyltransferase, partial [Methanosarcinales archaeon]
MVAPHGGKLIDQLLPENKVNAKIEEASGFPTLPINFETYIELENIAIGTFSPLNGYICSQDFDSILENNRLANDLPWTIPIVLDVGEKIAKRYEERNPIVLTFENEIVGILNLEEKYEYNKKQWAEKVFGTTDSKHPGVKEVFSRHEILLGGPITLLKRPAVSFSRYHLTPKESRILFKAKGWRTVVGFQTRNAPHIGHEYVQKTALTFVDGIFINPVIGKKKQGDFKDEVILESYQALIDHYYLKERAVLVTLLTEMRYAGPKEAIFHAIMRKNYGCSHFIVGRDHAGVGSYYPPFAAQDIFEGFPDLGIAPLFFRSFSYCKKCKSVVNEKTCPHPSEHHINFSGTKIRNM